MFVEDVLEHIDNLHCEGQLGYIGMFSPLPPGGQAPHRNPNDKWYISTKVNPAAFALDHVLQEPLLKGYKNASSDSTVYKLV